MKFSKKENTYLTSFYIILISLLISPLLIINSSYKIKQREIAIIQNNEKNAKIKSLRNLDFNSDSLEICHRGSKNLLNYFETGDSNNLKLYEYKEEKEPSDISIYLINILSNEGDSNKNNKNYLKHIAPMIIFLIFGFLCIPGWIIFCCCSFNGCKCFNGCKTIKCRIPFFVILSVINVFFIASCIAGFFKIEPIFDGLANTECSLLRFISEVLDGETKNNLPKWAGVSGIVNIFNGTINQIEKISRDNTLKNTEDLSKEYEEANKTFITALKSACNKISGESNYKYNQYIFDMAYNFGNNENGHSFTQGSYAEKWVKEAEISNDVKKCSNDLGKLIHSNAHETLKEAEKVIQDIGEGIEQLKDTIGENILEYSDKIDKNGKLIFRLIFSILLIISILLETFFICLLIFASRKYNYQKCASCMKCLINLFWNIMAILVIVFFLLGGIICLIGQIGEDFFEAFSFLISSKNLLAPSPRIFDDGGPYLDVCINGDGNITEELGIRTDLENIGALKTVTENLNKMIREITTKADNPDMDVVYDEIESDLNKRIYNQINYGFINSETKQSLTLFESLSQLNEKIDSCNIDDTWNISCPINQQDVCNSPINTSKCLSPKACNEELNLRYNIICRSTIDSINNINNIFLSADFANSETEGNSIRNQAAEVKVSYRRFISRAKEILSNYITDFRPFSDLYSQFIGNGNILSVINCAFIGKNVKVLLNYLNDTIDKGFLTLGIVLVMDGFIMLCSISLTILLLSIIDEVERIRKIEDEENDKTNHGENYNEGYKENVIPSAEIVVNRKK